MYPVAHYCQKLGPVAPEIFLERLWELTAWFSMTANDPVSDLIIISIFAGYPVEQHH